LRKKSRSTLSPATNGDKVPLTGTLLRIAALPPFRCPTSRLTLAGAGAALAAAGAARAAKISAARTDVRRLTRSCIVPDRSAVR